MQVYRIIPAYAGQIQPADIIAVKDGDHPRIRGTNLNHTLNVVVNEGSSPHTRDKYGIGAKTVKKIGIIPAYAGQMHQSRLQCLSP